MDYILFYILSLDITYTERFVLLALWYHGKLRVKDLPRESGLSISSSRAGARSKYVMRAVNPITGASYGYTLNRQAIREAVTDRAAVEAIAARYTQTLDKHAAASTDSTQANSADMAAQGFIRVMHTRCNKSLKPSWRVYAAVLSLLPNEQGNFTDILVACNSSPLNLTKQIGKMLDAGILVSVDAGTDDSITRASRKPKPTAAAYRARTVFRVDYDRLEWLSDNGEEYKTSPDVSRLNSSRVGRGIEQVNRVLNLIKAGFGTANAIHAELGTDYSACYTYIKRLEAAGFVSSRLGDEKSQSHKRQRVYRPTEKGMHEAFTLADVERLRAADKYIWRNDRKKGTD